MRLSGSPFAHQPPTPSLIVAHLHYSAASFSPSGNGDPPVLYFNHNRIGPEVGNLLECKRSAR